VDVLSQLEVVEGENKRKRKEQGRITMGVPGHELKGLLLNYALATRQRQEVAAANDKMALVDKNLASIEKEYAATKENILAELELLKSQHTEELSKLAKAHEQELEKAKKDQDVAMKTAKALQEDLTVKEGHLATIAKDNETALSELASLRQEKEKWESEKESLEENIGAQYEEGFSCALEQVKVLFPDIDQARLGEADAMLKIDGGKLVPFPPVEK
jgi:chromosome segregation ATPase